MEKRDVNLLKIFVRYLILLLIGVLGLNLFYIVFSPLTIFPVYFILNIFFDALLFGNKIVISVFSIEVINACVIGSAYSLLLILNLSVPNMKLKKRIYAILFSFMALLLINIFRIVLLSVLFVTNSPYFDATHKLFWYAGSIIFIVAIWFAEVKIFKMKDIPFYTDIKSFLKNIRNSKKSYKKPKHKTKKKSRKAKKSSGLSKKINKSKRKKKNK